MLHEWWSILMEIIKPMEPILIDQVVSGENWIHQVKWDGIRGISYIDNHSLKILTRRGQDKTELFPELQVLTRLVKGQQAILDGEMVVFNEESRPVFNYILARVRSGQKSLPYYQQKYPVNYIVFDILYWNGRDLRNLEYKERRALLKAVLPPAPNIAVTDDFADGKLLLKLLQTKQWEGIVSKQLDSPYRAGKQHGFWYKVKFKKRMLAVIGGIKLKGGRPNSLLAGIYQQGQLIYVASVSSGLKTQDFINLSQHLDRLRQEHPPFANLSSQGKDVVWIKPVLTCWLRFSEWTESGSLRHPQLIGFTDNKSSEADGREYNEEILNN